MHLGWTMCSTKKCIFEQQGGLFSVSSAVASYFVQAKSCNHCLMAIDRSETK